MILGSIMKSVKSSKSETEYQGMSILGLRDNISHFRLSFLYKLGCGTKYSCMAVPRSYSALAGICYCGDHFAAKGSHSETCSPMPAVLALIDGIISSVSGMDLEASKRIPVKGPKWEATEREATDIR